MEAIVNRLTQINLSVRRKTQFADMKRANKSRLQFKGEVVIHFKNDAGEGDSTTASDQSSGDQRARRGELDGYLEDFLASSQQQVPTNPGVRMAEEMEYIPLHPGDRRDNPGDRREAEQMTPATGETTPPAGVMYPMNGAAHHGQPNEQMYYGYNAYPMMFAAKPSQGQNTTPIYMYVGMMPVA